MIYHASNYRVCDYYCSKYYSSVITVDLITIRPARVELVNTLYTADETQLQSVYDSDDHRACTRGTRQYTVYSSDHRILVRSSHRRGLLHMKQPTIAHPPEYMRTEITPRSCRDHAEITPRSRRDHALDFT